MKEDETNTISPKLRFLFIPLDLLAVIVYLLVAIKRPGLVEWAAPVVWFAVMIKNIKLYCAARRTRRSKEN